VDLQALIAEPITLEPQKLCRIPTGIAMELPQGYVGLVYARSGLGAKHGIALGNGVGVIDSDYRGEILVGLCNLSDVPYTIRPMDRIAQLVIAPVPPIEYVWADSLSDTARGDGGFGSSGR
jgi:dUTP pyrophosphatase